VIVEIVVTRFVTICAIVQIVVAMCVVDHRLVAMCVAIRIVVATYNYTVQNTVDVAINVNIHSDISYLPVLNSSYNYNTSGRSAEKLELNVSGTGTLSKGSSQNRSSLCVQVKICQKLIIVNE
jgi:hypothetical protein